MSASQRIPTVAELRAIIESPEGIPWPRIAAGEVKNRCSKWTNAYCDALTQSGIPHARLSSSRREEKSASGHAYLAVVTADEGILIFDPTFKQMYPEFKGDYFLGKPDAFIAYIEQQQGAWERLLYEVNGRPINARGAFSIRGHEASLGAAKYNFREALSALPQQAKWEDFVTARQAARSSKLVSP
ncbi:MAG: hypothetical protein ACKVOE_06520 [Rickettsiales bacterium]